MSGGPHTIVYKWLKDLKIPASEGYIRQQLNSHPDYPSLLSFTDTLDELGIENTAIQIEKEQLPEMPVPFIVHLNGNGGEFVLVKNRDNLDKQFPDFFKRWGGVALAAEKTGGWQHKQNTEWLQKDKKQHAAILFRLVLLSAFILLSGVISFSWTQVGILFTAIAGVFVSWMIVSKDLGIENKMADQVCGKADDCNSVIHFGKIKLPLGIGWSDAGIIYFSFLLIVSVIASFTNTFAGINPILFLLAACSVPVTLLSIYYQWRVIKKWCRLCLVTVGLLWINFLILVVPIISGSLSKGNIKTITLNNAALILFLLFITAAAWFWLKPLLKENKTLETDNFAAKRFKSNADVFMALLEKQRKVDITPIEDDLQIGNPEASMQIMVACNPYCSPCAKAHDVLHELVERNDIGLTVRFTVKTEDKKDEKLQVAEYMLRLCKGKDELDKRKILHDWYRLMDMDKFKLHYPDGKKTDVGENLLLLEEWSKEARIEFTPTIFINGFNMPKQYKADDLSNLVRTVKERLPVKQNEMIEK